MHLNIILYLLFTVITVNNSENKFPAFGSSDSKFQNNQDGLEALKTEIKKYMWECGGRNSQEESTDSKYNKRNSSGSNDNNDRSGWRGYGNNQNTNSYGNWNDHHERSNSDRPSGGYGNYGSSNSNRNNRNNENTMRSNVGSWMNGGSSYGTSSLNRSVNPTDYGSYDYGRRTSGYGNDKSGSFSRGMDDSNGRRSDYDGYDGYRSGYMRTRRASDDDSECTAQCVLGYLEILDDNRSPSESALIKWLQDHVPNDTKRIKALRETRKCFARLAASDNEDGCEFSKKLSDCLNLEIEK